MGETTRRTSKRFCFCVAVLMLQFISVCVQGGNWPNYRGPQHNGTTTEKGWSDQWPHQGPKTVWNAVLGLGFTSMVVDDGRFYSVGHANDSDTSYCLDAETGKEIWK